ncbi:uncharacterized protein LOC114406916 isoform X1 [Glycine soja]|uniref:HR-like lesion-inducer n=1 Tax=Glycine soja TaxID=3848 RepID=A0A445LCL8_GLYSO|nr:uncharacterized protein LOC100817488 isoform X1 [Glycine max]XP_028225571.1 uncharacterized protein LOC114406916 isoform X1 [Glycine soja]RZC20940.1 hypothetical protein D0Y65_007331 [Glycine soja]|eukprot:XP_006576935.1 uncharacterized protein LOC100817488 isoform X1 [Glycine max]
MLPFPHPFFNLSFARCFSFVLALTGKRKTSFLQAPRFPLSLNGVLFFSRQSPLRLRFHPLRLPRMKFLVAGAIALKGLGGILFILSSSFGAFLLLLHQVITTPILYDFYNYHSEDKEFIQLFIKFTQNMALFGALLFFIGMKNSIPRRQPKKKAAKTKTY